ncbi:hypothetical protein H0H92_005794 [Tricholoma furcatifolium]|nr:hypothetical protein H0H92_005794 [Tricholoma furcatifolium]
MASTQAGPSQPPKQVHHLLPEILGFSPQLLLDDIINIANNAVQDGVNGMEEFLQKWVDARSERQNNDWDSTHDVEQGLVAFQTLLEHHTDLAFDFFEAWSLRNIFAIPPDLPIVVPHQQELNLTQTPEREQELMDELEQLRRRLDNVISQRLQRREEERLAQLSILQSPSLDILHSLPQKFVAMFNAVTALPPLEASSLISLRHGPGKRLWETGRTGYKDWAVGQLLARAESGDAGGKSVVDTLMEHAHEVGRAEQLRTAVEAMGGVKDDLDAVDASRIEAMEE